MSDGPAVSPTRILVVDDSDVIRSLLRRTLSLYAYEVSEAADGIDALTVLSQDRAFSLLIVDLAMPRMDGFSLIQRVRADSSLAGVPIMVLTGEDFAPEAEPPEGANALMAKPFKPSELLCKVKQLTSG